MQENVHFFLHFNSISNVVSCESRKMVFKRHPFSSSISQFTLKNIAFTLFSWENDVKSSKYQHILKPFLLSKHLKKTRSAKLSQISCTCFQTLQRPKCLCFLFRQYKKLHHSKSLQNQRKSQEKQFRIVQGAAHCPTYSLQDLLSFY